jgi:hypothetical protein
MYFVNFAPLSHILVSVTVFGRIPSLEGMVSLLGIILRFP